jgi:hypothetical protein
MKIVFFSLIISALSPPPTSQTSPHSFKKSRCDEDQGAIFKQARERSILRDQAGCVLERSSSCMLILAFD